MGTDIASIRQKIWNVSEPVEDWQDICDAILNVIADEREARKALEKRLDHLVAIGLVPK